MHFLRPFLIALSLSCLLLLSACTLALPIDLAAINVKEAPSLDTWRTRLTAAIGQRELQVFTAKPLGEVEKHGVGQELPAAVALVQLRNATTRPPLRTTTVATATLPLMVGDVVSATPALAAVDSAERLLFNQGAPHTLVRGVLPANGKRDYVVRALAGQILVVEVASPSGRVKLTVSPIGANQSAAPIVTEVLQWSGSVPSTQDYLITLTTPMATPFELSATLDPRQAAITPEPAPVRLLFGAASPSTTITEQVAAPERHRYLVRVGAGQTLKIELLSTGDVANFAVQGVTDGLPLKRLENAAHSWAGQASLTQDYLITVIAPGAPVDYTMQLALQ